MDTSYRTSKKYAKYPEANTQRGNATGGRLGTRGRTERSHSIEPHKKRMVGGEKLNRTIAGEVFTMRALVHASSSKANFYEIIATDGGRLLIEAGLPWSQLERRLEFNLKNIEACLISHEHL